MKIQRESNENIQWNSQIIKPNNENGKSSYIDIDNNENGNKLNNDDMMQGLRNNNMFDINTNDSVYRNSINPKSLYLIKMVGLALLGLGFADGFYRNEFPNQLCGLLIFLSCYYFQFHLSNIHLLFHLYYNHDIPYLSTLY